MRLVPLSDHLQTVILTRQTSLMARRRVLTLSDGCHGLANRLGGCRRRWSGRRFQSRSRSALVGQVAAIRMDVV